MFNISMMTSNIYQQLQTHPMAHFITASFLVCLNLLYDPSIKFIKIHGLAITQLGLGANSEFTSEKIKRNVRYWIEL